MAKSVRPTGIGLLLLTLALALTLARSREGPQPPPGSPGAQLQTALLLRPQQLLAPGHAHESVHEVEGEPEGDASFKDSREGTTRRSAYFDSHVYDESDGGGRLAPATQASQPHKPLLPLSWRDVAALSICAISLFIAAGGGIGGGGVLVPIYLLVLAFPEGVAVALSNITIVGGALANYLFNVRKRHPHYDRPLIDWDLILIMEPCTILGALVGGYVNKVSPVWLTTCLLTALLAVLTWKLAVRGVITWQKESDRLHFVAEQARLSEEGEATLTMPLLSDPANRQGSGHLRIHVRPIKDSSTHASGSHSHVGSPLAYTSLGSMGPASLPGRFMARFGVSTPTISPSTGNSTPRIGNHGSPRYTSWAFPGTNTEARRGQAALLGHSDGMMARASTDKQLAADAASTTASPKLWPAVSNGPELPATGDAENSMLAANQALPGQLPQVGAGPAAHAAHQVQLLSRRSWSNPGPPAQSRLRPHDVAGAAVAADASGGGHVAHQKRTSLLGAAIRHEAVKVHALADAPHAGVAAVNQMQPAGKGPAGSGQQHASDVLWGRSEQHDSRGCTPLSMQSSSSSIASDQPSPHLVGSFSDARAAHPGAFPPSLNGFGYSAPPMPSAQATPSTTLADRPAHGYGAAYEAEYDFESSKPGPDGVPLSPEQARALEAHMAAILADESHQLPWGKCLVLVAMFAGVIVSDKVKEKVPCGSAAYWGVVLAMVPVILLISLAVRHYLVGRYRVKRATQYEWHEGDVAWTPTNSIVFPLICSLAGLVAGMFGIGGGIVKGPLMLEMGVLPEVAAATSATMILFTAASASAVFISFGGIRTDYAMAVFLMGFVVTVAGQAVCNWLMARLGRRSIIIFAMAALMGLSLGAITYETWLAIGSAMRHHALLQRGHICAPRL